MSSPTIESAEIPRSPLLQGTETAASCEEIAVFTFWRPRLRRPG